MWVPFGGISTRRFARISPLFVLGSQTQISLMYYREMTGPGGGQFSATRPFLALEHLLQEAPTLLICSRKSV